MWITADGRLNTVAVPINGPSLREPQSILREAAPGLDDFDPWAEGGVAETAGDELRGRPGWSLADEAEYEAVAIPDEVVESFRWGRLHDESSALRELGLIDPRWRLDVALILEDLLVGEER